jgi:phytoene/squalene synthetase
MSASHRDVPHRDHDTENFPTASLILARPVRAQVMAFYRFVRTADDIADHATLPAAEKLRWRPPSTTPPSR